MKTLLKILIGFEFAVLTCTVCLLGENTAQAASSEAGLIPTERDAGPPTQLSTRAAEVIRLTESGVEEGVVRAYIENSQSPFELSAEDIVYLKDLGIQAPVIAAMVRHDTKLRDQKRQSEGVPSTSDRVANDPKQPTPDPNGPPPATQPVYVTNAPPEVAYFYDSLAPYGTWVELADYGWCWQPRIVVIDHSWRPYWQGGRWVYTDFGWYWRSDYSWGWGGFHYGRWHHHDRHGWVWFPDLVWGPAWVSWRYSDSHCGWAPLPPRARFEIGHGWRFNNVSVGINFDFHLGADLFTYVELRHMHDPSPHLHGIPPGRVKEIHNRTTVINNYIVGRDNRLVNQGVAVDRVAAASGRQIRPVIVKEDVPARAEGVTRRDRLSREGSESVLYRPVLKPPVNPRPIVAQKADEHHAIVRPPPQQRSAISPPPREPSRSVRPAPAPSIPSPRTPPPNRSENRGVTPAPPPAVPRETDGRTAPRTEPARPAPRPPGAALPAPPTTNPRPIPPVPRLESPRGRADRLSNGPGMKGPPQPAAPPASRRPPDRGREGSGPPSSERKND